jgi:biopolymer transport protein ExbD
MRSARRALRELERNELANKGEAPINLVPMIDILTVLVLYLLVGSVYEHLAILQLNLPAAEAAAKPSDKPVLQPTVIVRRDWLELRDRRGVFQRLDNSASGYELEALSGLLLGIKRQAPQETSITLLLEPNISYDTLVQVMDSVRLLPEGTAPEPGVTELFPAISIGDAPKAGTRS